MVFKTVYTEVEVDVDLESFDTDDLLEELELRGSLPPEADINAKELVEQMYLLHRQGQDCTHMLNKLFYSVLGRIAWSNLNGLCTVPCLDLWHRMHGPWSSVALKKHVQHVETGTNVMNTIEQIINRIKRLEQFVVKVSVPEGFAFSGAVPFDIEIAGSTAMVTVWAASEAVAQRRAEEFFQNIP